MYRIYFEFRSGNDWIGVIFVCDEVWDVGKRRAYGIISRIYFNKGSMFNIVGYCVDMVSL